MKNDNSGLKKKKYQSPTIANRLTDGTRFDLSFVVENEVDYDVAGDLPIVAAVAWVAGAGIAAGIAYTAIGGGCFLPGTKVNTSKNNYCKIENLDIGDLVLSCDTDTKELVQNPVVSTYRTMQPRYCVINGTIRVTETHPFFANGKWVKVKDLQKGDAFMDTDLRKVTVHSIDVIEEPSIVHNLKVSDTHTFFVDDILVHNKPEDESQTQILGF